MRWPQLKVLELSWNNPLVVDSAWSRLSGLTQLQALESLRVAYSTPLGSPFGGYPTLERMPALRSLEVTPSLHVQTTNKQLCSNGSLTKSVSRS